MKPCMLDTDIIIQGNKGQQLNDFFPYYHNEMTLEVQDKDNPDKQLILTGYFAENMFKCIERLKEAGIQTPEVKVKKEKKKVNYTLRIKNNILSYIRLPKKDDGTPVYMLTLTTIACSGDQDITEVHYNKVKQVVQELTQHGYTVNKAECEMRQSVKC